MIDKELFKWFEMIFGLGMIKLLILITILHTVFKK